ncbi:MAG: DUF2442 domain-containing protein [Campylobacterota bacterium]|nr:DUF2442 domain-containing protein [Campylobacterota bacterium]
MSTLKTKALITSIGFGEDKMYIELNTSRVLTVPYTYTNRLQNAKLDELKNYRLLAGGVGVHFEDIDEDLSVEGIIRDFGNESKRINISVQSNLLDQIDQYAKEHHMSRSALIQKATFEYIAS